MRRSRRERGRGSIRLNCQPPSGSKRSICSSIHPSSGRGVVAIANVAVAPWPSSLEASDSVVLVSCRTTSARAYVLSGAPTAPRTATT